jgi:hypothetical protein
MLSYNAISWQQHNSMKLARLPLEAAIPDPVRRWGEIEGDVVSTLSTLAPSQ